MRPIYLQFSAGALFPFISSINRPLRLSPALSCPLKNADAGAVRRISAASILTSFPRVHLGYLSRQVAIPPLPSAFRPYTRPHPRRLSSRGRLGVYAGTHDREICPAHVSPHAVSSCPAAVAICEGQKDKPLAPKLPRKKQAKCWTV